MSTYTAFMYLGRLVEYGPTTQVSRNSDGIVTAQPESRTCWGESSRATKIRDQP